MCPVGIFQESSLAVFFYCFHFGLGFRDVPCNFLERADGFSSASKPKNSRWLGKPYEWRDRGERRGLKDVVPLRWKRIDFFLRLVL